MELGKKIREARLEAGLSQRQLCADVITRNMLSQIENGSARPSMDTLRSLAERLGKTLSYFLEEEAITSPNQELMDRARKTFETGDPAAAREILEQYKAPDPVFDREYHLVLALCLMELAKQALAENRRPYAEALLQQAAEAGSLTPYYTPAMERERLLLLAAVSPAPSVEAALPRDDRELLLRAEAALVRSEYDLGLACLEAAWDRESPRWHLLRGETALALKDYDTAATHYRKAEAHYPTQVHPRLEVCFRELGDFKKAYEYACKQR